MNAAIEALANSPVRRHQQPESPKPADTEGAPTEGDKLPEATRIYDTLADLVKAEPIGEKGKRPYEVHRGLESDPVYVFTNSPAQAALLACNVSTVSQKQLLAALTLAFKSK